MLPEELSAIIKREAQSAGFDMCGITDTGELTRPGKRLNAWLSKGLNGEMDFMSRHSGKRSIPSMIMPDARTVIVVALNYFSPPPAENDGTPIISRYASGTDYHVVMKAKLKKVLYELKVKIPGLEGRVFVDSAPLMEKALAVKAGLGWQGKNTLLLSKGAGSFFFLGEIVINLEARYDEAFTDDNCGSCTNCINACPTGAISEEGYLDARKCISYLSIELRGDIPNEFRGKLENRVFGCDICQDACPHNQALKHHKVSEFSRSSELSEMTLSGWRKLTPEKFSDLFAESAVSRCGYDKLMRNLHFEVF